MSYYRQACMYSIGDAGLINAYKMSVYTNLFQSDNIVLPLSSIFADS